MKVFGLIVAAGLSSRMSVFKPLLPLSGHTLLETTVTSLRNSGIKDVCVVVGYQANELYLLLEQLDVRIVENKQYKTSCMFDSVKLGLRSIANKADAFLFLPGDMPLVRSHSISAMIDMQKTTGAALIRPLYRGKRGHPPLIMQECFAKILSYSGGCGLRGALDNLNNHAEELELPDPGLVMDADTLTDYEAILRCAERGNIPTDEVCEDIWRYAGTPEHVWEHCRAVAATSKAYAVNLRSKDYPVDPELTGAGGLLHDVMRGHRNHALHGAAILKNLGYKEVANVVGAHTDLPADAIETIDERSLVYLADKMVIDGRHCSIDERFNDALSRYDDEPEAIRAVHVRKDAAERVYLAICCLIGSNNIGSKIKCDANFELHSNN
jgi:molybdenum cofactor cytidylyltransferase